MLLSILPIDYIIWLYHTSLTCNEHTFCSFVLLYFDIEKRPNQINFGFGLLEQQSCDTTKYFQTLYQPHNLALEVTQVNERELATVLL